MMVTTKTNTSIRSVQTMRLVKFPLKRRGKNIDTEDAKIQIPSHKVFENYRKCLILKQFHVLPHIEENIYPIEHQVGNLCSKNDIIEKISGIG